MSRDNACGFAAGSRQEARKPLRHLPGLCRRRNRATECSLRGGCAVVVCLRAPCFAGACLCVCFLSRVWGFKAGEQRLGIALTLYIGASPLVQCRWWASAAPGSRRWRSAWRPVRPRRQHRPPRRGQTSAWGAGWRHTWRTGRCCWTRRQVRSRGLVVAPLFAAGRGSGCPQELRSPTCYIRLPNKHIDTKI